MADLPKRAQVVIVGGGIVGCSVAYHLTLRGCVDVVLLERKKLTSGTTWHAAGLVGQLRATRNLTRLAQYTTELYATLETETGQSTGFRQIGSVAVATSDGRMEELKRGASMARSFGLQVDVISAERAHALWPFLNADDILGAVHLPKDGQTNPIDTTQALAKGARSRGARLVEDTKVDQIVVENGKAIGVLGAFATSRPTSLLTALACGRMNSARKLGRRCLCTRRNTSTLSPNRSQSFRVTFPCCGTQTDAPTSRRTPENFLLDGSSRSPSHGE